MSSRRKFLTDAGTLAAGALGATALSVPEEKPQLSSTKTVGLCGQWRFSTQPTALGAGERRPQADFFVDERQNLGVPPTRPAALASGGYRRTASSSPPLSDA